jgi:hypothetical protein
MAPVSPQNCGAVPRMSVEDQGWFFGGSGRTAPIASMNCAVVASHSSVQRSPPVAGGPSPGVETTRAEPNTDRSGRGSLSYISSNRKIPARRSSVGHDRFKPG